MNPLQVRFNSSLRKYLPDPFIIGLLMMIFLAWLYPGIGLGNYSPNLGNFIDAGISLIFLFYGLKLNPAKIRQGMSNWRMHLSIQLTTFLVFPLLVLPFYPLVRGTSLEIFWLGLFFMAALPSTVSSSVVMVSIAGEIFPEPFLMPVFRESSELWSHPCGWGCSCQKAGKHPTLAGSFFSWSPRLFFR